MTDRPSPSPAAALMPGIPPTSEAADFDRAYRARLAHLTQGISPAALCSAYMDWLVHLSMSPGKQSQLFFKAQYEAMELILHHSSSAEVLGTQTEGKDHRFDAPEWGIWPFNFLRQAFHAKEQWWHSATTGVEGVSAHHEQMMSFFTRQWLDMMSPANCLASNPEAMAETFKSGGLNLVRGLHSRFKDAMYSVNAKSRKEALDFRPGHEVALTSGKVVFRNPLIELIQYSPQTDSVYKEPVLIIPSWIMKFYILDLSPQNSLVRYLVEQGHTVFMVSWKNPEASDRDLGMDDYLKEGVMAAIGAVDVVVPKHKIHSLGYCLGGTLLAIAAAYMARSGDDRLESITLFASLIDFSEPGELGLFIDESQLAYLDDLMSEKGYLDGKQMAGAFALLNSRDLVWSRMEHEYLMGRSHPVNDLVAWNADATRMPYRQHHEYLRSLYLHNDLAEGRYLADGVPVALSDIQVPVFVLGTQKDTVSPWRSVYKIHLLMNTELTFCLSSGGHNVGIVNPPGPGVKRGYQIGTHAQGDHYKDPGTWSAMTLSHEGSWWPAWQAWLASHSSRRGPPPAMGGRDHGSEKMVDAPGRYVLSA